TIAVTRDASRVATGQRNGSIRVWAPADGTGPATFGPIRPRQAIVDLAFAPSGDLLVSLGRSGEGALRFWRPDGTTWVEVASMPMGRCLASRFDGAGEHLAVMCEREVVVVDLGTRLASSRITSPHSEVMTAFYLSANGTRLVTAGHAGGVTVWDPVPGTPTRPLRLTEDRRLLARAGDRRGMRVFDLTRKSVRVTATGAKAYATVAITDDATGFAAITSATESGNIVYDVEIWRVTLAPDS